MSAFVKCRTCGGLGRLADHPCDTCRGAGSVKACISCKVEPRDPMFAPACSGTCRQAWETAQRLAELRTRAGRCPRCGGALPSPLVSFCWDCHHENAEEGGYPCRSPLCPDHGSSSQPLRFA